VAPPLRTGINTVTRKQRDGSVVRHYYDRATKQYLGTDKQKAIDAIAGRPGTPPAGTFAALCADYLGSTKYKAL
jgi:hypothetical protein